MSATEDFPTVLVAELDETASKALCVGLRDEGYNVLEAHDWSVTVDFIRFHSRPIHLLITKAGIGTPKLAESIKPYRPHMHILFIGRTTEESHPSVVHPEVALAKVRELIKPPTRPSEDFY